MKLRVQLLSDYGEVLLTHDTDARRPVMFFPVGPIVSEDETYEIRGIRVDCDTQTPDFANEMRQEIARMEHRETAQAMGKKALPSDQPVIPPPD